jgi:hypothetical protein
MKQMPYKTGNSVHDQNVAASELAFQNAQPFANQAAAKAADLLRLQTIVTSGQQNGVSVVNQMTALKSLQTTGSA